MGLGGIRVGGRLEAACKNYVLEIDNSNIFTFVTVMCVYFLIFYGKYVLKKEMSVGGSLR